MLTVARTRDRIGGHLKSLDESQMKVAIALANERENAN